MMWTSEVSLDDFRAKMANFIAEYGIGDMSHYLNQASRIYYNARQFSVNEDYLVTWAYLSPEQENDFVTGKCCIFEDIGPDDNKRLWLMDAYIEKLQTAKQQLKKFSVNNTHCRFISTHHGKLLKVHNFALNPSI